MEMETVTSSLQVIQMQLDTLVALGILIVLVLITDFFRRLIMKKS